MSSKPDIIKLSKAQISEHQEQSLTFEVKLSTDEFSLLPNDHEVVEGDLINYLSIDRKNILSAIVLDIDTFNDDSDIYYLVNGPNNINGEFKKFYVRRSRLVHINKYEKRNLKL